MSRPRKVPIPSLRQVMHWAEICAYLDTLPQRLLCPPFPREPLITGRLLRRMEAFKLVRHRDNDCHWRLALHWREIIVNLANGLPPESIPRRHKEDIPEPFVVDTGVDTLYVNLFGEELPEGLIELCTELKRQALEADDTIITPWEFFDIPLNMYKTGSGTKKGKGVSWSFILRNDLVMIVLRKSALGELLGSVRLSAKVLWTWGPRDALDAMKASLIAMWDSVEEGSFGGITLRLSQIHLCADIAHFHPQPIDLERVVTHSIKRGIHIPSLADESAPDFAIQDEEDAFFLDVYPDEWVGIPDDVMDATEAEDWESEEEDEREDDEDPADEEGALLHMYGRRASGFAFSQGSELSAAWYNKTLQERLSGKLDWMVPIHEAGGWTQGMTLFRVEGRFRRGVLRELAPEDDRWVDDPWLTLDHLQDLWGHFGGLPPEADYAPDVTHRGWMRLAIPNPNDDTRSRWPTDPVWQIIQRAKFTDHSIVPLSRHKERKPNLDHLDAVIYGLLKLRSVMRGVELDDRFSWQQELMSMTERFTELDEERKRNYAFEVREKARQMGRAVSYLPPPRPKPSRKKGGV